MTNQSPTCFERAAGNLTVWALALPILEELMRHGIPTLVLKSLPQMEELYGDIGARASTDVDILVPHQRAREAVDLIRRQEGWRMHEQSLYDALTAHRRPERVAGSQPWHFIRRDGEVASIVDLHFDASDREQQPPLDRAIWERAVPVSRDGVDFLTLGPEDRLVFLCWHFFKDSVRTVAVASDKLGDIAMALRAGDAMDWEYVGKRARATGTALMVHLACDLAAMQAAPGIAPHWREYVPLRSRRRYRLLWTRFALRLRDLGARERGIWWLLAHDRLLDPWPRWRQTLLPDRATIATTYSNRWPSWPRYIVELAKIYLHRLRKGLPFL